MTNSENNDNYVPNWKRLEPKMPSSSKLETLCGENSSHRYAERIFNGVGLRILASLLILIAVMSCQETEVGKLTPTPTPPSVEAIYRALEQENIDNSNRLRILEDERQVLRFRGNITKIDTKEIRFYIAPPRPLANDLYVECNFGSHDRIAQLNVGEEVSVRGELARAFRGRLWGIGENQAVVFEHCQIEE